MFKDTSKPKIWNAFQYRVLAALFVSLTIFLIVSLYMMKTVAREYLEERESKKIESANYAIAKELETNISIAHSLAVSMAKVAEKLPNDTDTYNKVFRHLLVNSPRQHIIAGGGVWPEPYSFEPGKQRSSFFWGKDEKDILHFFDDYNQQDGNGYHNEAWYVPSKYQLDGEIMWSGSYIDPYSKEPMITITAPVFKEKRFFGVTTVDMNLSGIDEIVRYWSKSLGLYAFVVDRNDKLISKLPGNSQTASKEYETLSHLSSITSSFSPIHDSVAELTNSSLFDSGNLSSITELAGSIANNSYQIDLDNARIISAIIYNQRFKKNNKTYTTKSFTVDSSPFFDNKGFVSILQMPDTYWKVVTVLPYSDITAVVDDSISKIINPLVYIGIISILLLYIFIHIYFIRPVKSISLQLESDTGDTTSFKKIETRDKGELGYIVSLLNLHRTELREAYKKLVHEKQSAEIANTAKSDFLSSMSHELRTPLNAILGFAQLLQTPGKNPTENASENDFVDEILNSGHLLLDLIDSLLDLSRIENNQVLLNMEPVCLHEVTTQVISMMQPLADNREITITNMVNQDPHLFINVDRKKFKQILVNFISNAIKYNTHGGQVTLSCSEESSGRIRIYISDTGNGVAEESLSELFEAFNRLDKINSGIQGTGIGLSISKQLTELMNGTIGAENNPGNGMTFWAEFDIYQLDKPVTKTNADNPAFSQASGQ